MDRESFEIPVNIKPALNCQWRWLDTSSLACQLGDKDALKPATRYRITMIPGIKAEDGETLASKKVHLFLTQRAKVSNAWFDTWTSPGTPKIEVRFEKPVRKSSIKKHLYMKTRTNKRVPLDIEESTRYAYYEKGTIWLVSPTKPLPLDAAVELRVEPGLLSTEGTAPGIEDRVITSFHTFPEFRFTGVECTNNSNRTIVFSSGEETLSSCNPLRQAKMVFTVPVTKEDLKDVLSVTPDLRGGRTDYDPWSNVYSPSRLNRPHRKRDSYSLRLPEVLKAFDTYTIKADRATVKDVFGRSLQNDIDITFKTDHRKPNYSISSPFYVLEKNVDTDVPLVVTNLKDVSFDYQTMTAKGKSAGKTSLKVDAAEDISYKMALKVREMIPSASGAIKATFDTAPHIKDKGDKSRWFFAEVTPYNVHVKIGHFNTMVWVVDYATGKPVKGVEVSIFKDKMGSFGDNPTSLLEAKTNKDGIAVLQGTSKFDPKIDLLRGWWWDLDDTKLFVRCKKGDDLAIMPIVNEFLVDARGANDQYISSWSEPRYGHMRAWGTTAQGVYKAGDTIQYKFYVRDQTNEAFALPPLGKYTLKVMDPMGKVAHQVDNFTLSEFASYDGEFVVPKSGAVGWYRFELTASFKSGKWQPMRVLVSDFTPAPFRVTTDLNGELFRTGDSVKVKTAARLHAGGPYVDAQTRVTARVKGSYFRPKDPKAKGFYFDVSSHRFGTKTVHQSQESVDNKGDLASEFTITDTPVVYGRLMVESAVRDDRGKYISGRATATYVGRDRYVGILQKDWVLKEGKAVNVDVIVVDEFGNAASGTEGSVKVEYRKTVASRVKGAGNAYLTQYKHEWIEVKVCEFLSAQDAQSCEFTPEAAGSFRMTAAIKDTKGRSHSSATSRWVVGKGRVLWETRPDNTLDIFPEKEDVKVGEKARYMVQNPYPGAKALITIERYGVLKSWLKTFENSTEIIEFPVLPDYLPGYYLSITILSPRQVKPLGDGGVDLGKPAFRMGYVRVPVKDPYKEIKISVVPTKEIYKPRETVTVDLKAALNAGRGAKAHPPMELAVVVLDEAVFDLIKGGSSYFDPYKGFYNLSSLDIMNYSLLKQLLGRQKFEKKGASPGGGGGMDVSMRSFFKFVSYWNPSIKTDRKGKASFSFELPDNLTGWKVLVIAVTDSDHMGLGDAVFKVNRPTEIRPALPNQVTEGDKFKAGFTVMNRTDAERTLEVQITATGPIDSGEGTSVQVNETITAEPYKRYTVWLPVETTDSGEITFTVSAGDSIDRDGLKKTIEVRRVASLETAATYGTTTSEEVTENIKFPDNIRTDVGRVSVVASPTVIGSVEGAFKYMKDYPYICWEQMLSKGVMASHYRLLKGYIPESFVWEGNREVTAKTLELASSHQAPNGGMVYYVPEDRYVSPYLSAYTALAFNWLEASGEKIPTDVQERLHGYLEKLLRRNVMPTFYSKGMSSTVRAVALAALAPHGKITRGDLNRYRLHLPEMSLFGKAHYLLALLEVTGTENIQAEVVDMILAHSNQSGGKFIFSESLDSGYDRILTSTLRDNGAVLSALVAYAEKTPGAADKVGDVPFKLVRALTQTRGQKDRWENTQENMFCLNAIIDYSRVYEFDKPKMTVAAWLDSEAMGEAKFTDFRDEPTDFERAIKEGDPGRKATVKITREGVGRVYYSTRLFFAPEKLKESSTNAGIEVRREYSVERDGEWKPLGREMEIKTGELVMVDLYISLPAARNFVIVDDPVPGGLEPVNRDLATASTVDADKAKMKRSGASFWFTRDEWMSYGFSRWSFYHKELRHHAARFYSEYLPAGNYHLSYTAQAIAPGEFTIMPLHAEEMYDPDVFGKGVPAKLDVERAD
jgi:uncharacterized protein YfaS (alpha-2-macroglobulin family)